LRVEQAQRELLALFDRQFPRHRITDADAHRAFVAAPDDGPIWSEYFRAA
jgi:hypothetical protein